MFLFDNGIISGYACFRIPGVVTTARGTVLAYCEARRDSGDWAEIDILYRRSTDGGRRFAGPAVLASGAEKRQTVNNPVMIAAKDGAVHLLYCVEYGVAERGGGVFYRRSDDDGLTWSDPRDISAMTAPEIRNVFATGPGHGTELADGTLFVPCWTVLKQHRKPADSHHPGTVCALTSRDRGATWAVTAFVPNGRAKDPNETAAAQLPDGRIVLSVRDGNTHCRCYAASDDGGSFSPIEPLPELPDPICCAGMTAVGNELFLTHCHDKRRRANLTLLRSRDGRGWKTVRTVVPGPAGYSDLTCHDGRLLILCEEGAALTLHRVLL